MKEDLSVVIRSIGERTESLCYRSICTQSSKPANIEYVIGEKPFSQALEKSLLKALDMGSKWSLIVDADLVLLNDSLSVMLKHAERAGDMVFRVNPKIYDKFLGFPTFGGPHLYRTKYVEEALKHIQSDEVTTRPETDMCRAVARKGLRLVNVNNVVALHDYEQFYKDIYRKYVFRSVKMLSIVRYLINRFYFMSFVDADFKVALSGLLYGINKYNGKMYNVNHHLDFNMSTEEKTEIQDFDNCLKRYNNKYKVTEDLQAKERLIKAEKTTFAYKLSAKLIRMFLQ